MMRAKRIAITLVAGSALSVAVANSARAAVGTHADSSGEVIGWGLNTSGQITVPSGAPTGYDTWRANFGATLGSGAHEAAAVPEPASLVLLALGGLFATFIIVRHDQEII